MPERFRYCVRMISWSNSQLPTHSPFSHDYTPPRKMGLGVIGLGEGRSIVSAAVSSRLWTLVNICDLNTELIAERKKEFGLECPGTTRMEELLVDPAIDAIAIYTPDALHAQHIRSTLEAGKHVICTKPLITDLSHGPSLLAAARAAGCQVLVGQSSRFIHPMWRQREDVVNGLHGALTAVEAHYFGDHRWFYTKPWTRGEGVNEVFQGLSHAVDLVRGHLPDIEEVMGYGLSTRHARALGQINPDALHFVMKTRSGELARVSGHYGQLTLANKAQDMIQCIVRGTEGVSIANFAQLNYQRRIMENGQAVEREEDFSAWHPYYWRFGGHSHHAGEFQNYLDHLARSLHEKTLARPDLRDGLRTVATLEAMNRSVKTGQPQRVSAVLAEFGLPELCGPV